jgi:hypothetical protein
MCDYEEDRWINKARRRDRLALITVIAEGYKADETPEDSKRRILTVLWIASGGDLGCYGARTSPEDLLRVHGYTEVMQEAMSVSLINTARRWWTDNMPSIGRAPTDYEVMKAYRQARLESADPAEKHEVK